MSSYVILFSLFVSLVTLVVLLWRSKEAVENQKKKLSPTQRGWREFHSQVASSYEVGGAGYDMGSSVTVNNDLNELEAKNLPSQIKPRAFLNESEMLIYKAFLNSDLQKCEVIIAPQVAMSEFVLDQNKKLVKQKYYGLSVDFLVAGGEGCLPLFVVEFHDKGHFGEEDEQKKLNKELDELKKEVLKEAGINLFVINYWGVCSEKSGKMDGRKLRFAVKRILNQVAPKFEVLQPLVKPKKEEVEPQNEFDESSIEGF